MYSAEEIHKLLSHVDGDISLNLRDIKIICELAKRVPEGAIVLEIGTRWGRSACVWALAIKNSQVYTIDTNDNRAKVIENATKAGVQDRVHPIWGTSFRYVWDKPIDVVFIDGDHTFPSAYADIEKWHPKARVLTCGHDYNHADFPGVKRAVHKYFNEQNFSNLKGIWAVWKPQPLIVTGMSRSGTTITADVLNTHPEISITQERMVIWCCLKFIDELEVGYPKYKGKLGVREKTIADFERTRSLIAKGFRKAIEDIYDAKQYRYYGDKFPHYIFRMHHVRRIFPNAKFIISYKDNLEECTKSALSQWWALEFNITVNSYKDMWDRAMAVIDREKRNPNVFILDYSLFCKDPKVEMDKVAEFLGVENKFSVRKVIKEGL